MGDVENLGDWETEEGARFTRLWRARGKSVEGAVGLESYSLPTTRYLLLSPEVLDGSLESLAGVAPAPRV